MLLIYGVLFAVRHKFSLPNAISVSDTLLLVILPLTSPLVQDNKACISLSTYGMVNYFKLLTSGLPEF
jgi:hypothetical protein